MPFKANKEYLKILALAAKESQAVTEKTLGYLILKEITPTASNVTNLVAAEMKIPETTDVQVDSTDLAVYDSLLERMV